ncbi:transposase [Microbacterium trichothecenolyticum]
MAAVRAAAFAAHSLPIALFPDAERLYSATGLAPALYESSTLRRRARISRQGLAEHHDALMGIAWGLSRHSLAFAERNAELRAGGMAPIQARVALARNACRLIYRVLVTQQPFDEKAYVKGGSAADGDGDDCHAARRRDLACRPPRAGPPLTANTKARRTTAPDQPAELPMAHLLNGRSSPPTPTAWTRRPPRADRPRPHHTLTHGVKAKGSSQRSGEPSLQEAIDRNGVTSSPQHSRRRRQVNGAQRPLRPRTRTFRQTETGATIETTRRDHGGGATRSTSHTDGTRMCCHRRPRAPCCDAESCRSKNTPPRCQRP